MSSSRFANSADAAPFTYNRGVITSQTTPAVATSRQTPKVPWFGAEGAPLPLGQSWVEKEQAFNFSLHSENAERVTLLLYGADDLVTPLLRMPLDPLVHKLRGLWF